MGAIQNRYFQVLLFVLFTIVLLYFFYKPQQYTPASNTIITQHEKTEEQKDDKVDGTMILEFEVESLLETRKKSKVAGIGFSKEELVELMEFDSPLKFSFHIGNWKKSLEDKKSILLVDFPTFYADSQNTSLSSLLALADHQVTNYLGIFANFENTTLGDDLFQFIQHHRVWDFEYTNRIAGLQLVLLKSRGYASEWADLFTYLNSLQYPDDCSNVKWAVHPHYPCGLACIVHFLQYGLTWCAVNNYTLAIIKGAFGYAGAPCPYEDYRCQFTPIPQGTLSNSECINGEGCPFDETKDSWIMHGYALPPSNLPEYGRYTLEQGTDQFWWRVGLQNYLIRPNQILFWKIRNAIEWLNNLSPDGTMFPCISMHVRRGDKKFEHAPTKDDLYVNALVEYQKTRVIDGLNPLRNVFIMTDDQYFIGNITILVPENKYFILDIPRAEIKPIVGGYEQGLDVMVETYIAAQCEHFIGTFSSNVGRLVAEISGIDKKTSQSLDSPWNLAP